MQLPLQLLFRGSLCSTPSRITCSQTSLNGTYKQIELGCFNACFLVTNPETREVMCHIVLHRSYYLFHSDKIYSLKNTRNMVNKGRRDDQYPGDITSFIVVIP